MLCGKLGLTRRPNDHITLLLPRQASPRRPRTGRKGQPREQARVNTPRVILYPEIEAQSKDTEIETQPKVLPDSRFAQKVACEICEI